MLRIKPPDLGDVKLQQSKHGRFLGRESVYNIACALPSYQLLLFQQGCTGECPSLETGAQFLQLMCTERTSPF